MFSLKYSMMDSCIVSADNSGGKFLRSVPSGGNAIVVNPVSVASIKHCITNLLIVYNFELYL